MEVFRLYLSYPQCPLDAAVKYVWASWAWWLMVNDRLTRVGYWSENFFEVLYSSVILVHQIYFCQSSLCLWNGKFTNECIVYEFLYLIDSKLILMHFVFKNRLTFYVLEQHILYIYLCIGTVSICCNCFSSTYWP